MGWSCSNFVVNFAVRKMPGMLTKKHTHTPLLTHTPLDGVACEIQPWADSSVTTYSTYPKIILTWEYKLNVDNHLIIKSTSLLATSMCTGGRWSAGMSVWYSTVALSHNSTAQSAPIYLSIITQQVFVWTRLKVTLSHHLFIPITSPLSSSPLGNQVGVGWGSTEWLSHDFCQCIFT